MIIVDVEVYLVGDCMADNKENRDKKKPHNIFLNDIVKRKILDLYQIPDDKKENSNSDSKNSVESAKSEPTNPKSTEHKIWIYKKINI